MAAKKQIRKLLIGNIISDIEGPIDNAIKQLSLIKEKYKDYTSISINGDYEHGYDGQYYELSVYGWRDETLLEEKRRLKDEERIRGSHIEQQRILYEKLKKKFGD